MTYSKSPSGVPQPPGFSSLPSSPVAQDFVVKDTVCCTAEAPETVTFAGIPQVTSAGVLPTVAQLSEIGPVSPLVGEKTRLAVPVEPARTVTNVVVLPNLSVTVKFGGTVPVPLRALE
jgi:hypothetical protein